MASALQLRASCAGYSLVFTGHSLGAGAAALVTLKLLARYPGMPVPSVPLPWWCVSWSVLFSLLTCCARASRVLDRPSSEHGLSIARYSSLDTGMSCAVTAK